MRFEYKCLTLKLSIWQASPEKRTSDFESQLNTLGAQGWKMTGATPYGQYVQIFMMREK